MEISAEEEQPSRCSNCNKIMQKVLQCGRCKAVSYCSGLCQKDDWPYHKKTCKTSEGKTTEVRQDKMQEAAEEDVVWLPHVAQQIERLRAGDESLIALDLRQSQIGNEVAKTLGAVLGHVTLLESLMLQDNNIGVLGAQGLACNFRCLKALKQVILDNNFMEVRGVDAICKGLLDVGTLTELRLANNLLGPKAAESVAELLLAIPSLNSVDMRDNFLREEGMEILADKLSNRELAFEQDLKLDFGGNDLRVGGGKAIGKLLRSVAAIRSLELQENKIHDFGVKAIAGALAQSKTILHLGLARNLIGNDGAIALADALSRNSSLQSLDLGGDIRDRCIGDEGAASISNALERNTTLLRLDLSCNVLSDLSGDALMVAMLNNSTLTFLSLTGNNISLEKMDAVAERAAMNDTPKT